MENKLHYSLFSVNLHRK